MTKRIGRGMHEWAAKVDEYARGMIGPQGSTLFEELGLYYIGPVDGHNIEDLISVLQEVASLGSMGPVLVHVVTEENRRAEDTQKSEAIEKQQEGTLFPFFFQFVSSFKKKKNCQLMTIELWRVEGRKLKFWIGLCPQKKLLTE